MKLSDEQKRLLSDVFIKTAEYILAIIVLGQIVSGQFNIWIFLIGLVIFMVMVVLGIMMLSFIKRD